MAAKEIQDGRKPLRRASSSERAIAELELIEDVRQRIDRVAEDIATGKKTYAAIDATRLADLLGLDFNDRSQWGQSWWAPRAKLSDNCDEYPFAENVELLLGHISENRFQKLNALANDLILGTGTETSQPTQSDKKEDLPLTKREKRLLGSLYADQEPDEDDEDAVLFEENSTSLTSSTGVDLPFSVLIGDAGEVFDVIGPFDEDRDLDDEYIEVW